MAVKQLSPKQVASGHLRGAVAALVLSAYLPGFAYAQSTNVHMHQTKTLNLPGIGWSVAWSPQSDRVAVAGNFSMGKMVPAKERGRALRYDTKVFDASTGLMKSFACHHFYTQTVAWGHTANSGVGYDDLLADGAGDHAVKLWDPDGAGSVDCGKYDLGKYEVSEGAIPSLARRPNPWGRMKDYSGFMNINGWIHGLEFSPDGRYLAGASRDRSVRIWQIAPGKNQWKIVRLWVDKTQKELFSISWRSDGRAIATSDKGGRVSVFPFIPQQTSSVDELKAGSLWDDATIDEYSREGEVSQIGWWTRNKDKTTNTPLWTDQITKVVIKRGIPTVVPVQVPAWHVRYSPDGSKVAATREDGTVTIFNGLTGAKQRQITLPSASIRVPSANGLDWHPGGKYLAVGSSDKNIYLFDSTNGSLYDTLTGHNNLVVSVQWSPDGQKLASTAGGRFRSSALHNALVGPDMTARIWEWR